MSIFLAPRARISDELFGLACSAPSEPPTPSPRSGVRPGQEFGSGYQVPPPESVRAVSVPSSLSMRSDPPPLPPIASARVAPTPSISRRDPGSDSSAPPRRRQRTPASRESAGKKTREETSRRGDRRADVSPQGARAMSPRDRRRSPSPRSRPRTPSPRSRRYSPSSRSRRRTPSPRSRRQTPSPRSRRRSPSASPGDRGRDRMRSSSWHRLHIDGRRYIDPSPDRRCEIIPRRVRSPEERVDVR